MPEMNLPCPLGRPFSSSTREKEKQGTINHRHHTSSFHIVFCRNAMKTSGKGVRDRYLFVFMMVLSSCFSIKTSHFVGNATPSKIRIRLEFKHHYLWFSFDRTTHIFINSLISVTDAHERRVN